MNCNERIVYDAQGQLNPMQPNNQGGQQFAFPWQLILLWLHLYIQLLDQ